MYFGKDKIDKNKNIKCQKLRHSFGIYLLLREFDLRYVQGLLGYKRRKMQRIILILAQRIWEDLQVHWMS